MTSFSPVAYEYREIIEENIGGAGKIFFFNEVDQVDSVEGKIMRTEEIPGRGMFVMLEPQAEVRIDRIITLFGKPGAACDEYYNYANQCLACTGGYDL